MVCVILSGISEAATSLIIRCVGGGGGEAMDVRSYLKLDNKVGGGMSEAASSLIIRWGGRMYHKSSEAGFEKLF